jgi:hypothetical protein
MSFVAKSCLLPLAVTVASFIHEVWIGNNLCKIFPTWSLAAWYFFATSVTPQPETTPLKYDDFYMMSYIDYCCLSKVSKEGN